MSNVNPELKAHPLELTVRVSAIEYMGALLCILWGGWLLVYPETSMTSVGYDLLLERTEPFDILNIGNVRTLGLLCIFTGAFYAIAVKINGQQLMWTPFVRAIGSIQGMFYFAYISIGFAQGPSSTSTAVPVYAFISACFFCLFYINLHRISAAVEIITERLRWKA